MKILVTVKEVATLGDRFAIEDGDVAPGDLEFELNEWDDYALEEAVQLGEEDADVEVVVATIGPERAEETIRMTLAKGADRAIRIWDDVLATADELGPATKATLLGKVVEAEDPDLVMTGVQAGDDANSATGVTLARSVGYEWAAVVNELEITPGADGGTVHRELEGGMEEILRIDLPAVLTIQTGLNEPRYASLRGIRQAQRKPIDVQRLADLGLDEGVTDVPIERRSMAEPESESDATIWEGTAGETAGELANLLRDRGLVEG